VAHFQTHFSSAPTLRTPMHPLAHRPLPTLALPHLAVLRLPLRALLMLPHRGTGLALGVRPGVRASASAALTQALLQGVQRLGPERISSAALARPTRVAPALCPGTAPEQVAPIVAPRSAPNCAQRRWHAPCAISAVPSERRRAGHAANAAPAARPGLIRAAQPAASEGSEGSRALLARPRMHERGTHAWGAAQAEEGMQERVAQGSGNSNRNEAGA
jgi:hypothetical protein